jgi:hypothetical protein
MSNTVNLFERAKNIRIKGESWQNCIQRAKAQIKYEGQLGGNENTPKRFSFKNASNNLKGGYFRQSSSLSNTSSTRTSDFTHVSDTTSYTITGGGLDMSNSSSSYSLSGGSDMSYTSDDNVSVSSVW